MIKIPAPKTHIVLICAGLFCFLTASVLLHSFRGRFEQESTAGLPDMEDTIDVAAPSSAKASGSGQPSSVLQENAAGTKWVIYVTGFVKNPGVYEIAPGSRVYQALEAAGGFAADADREGINLASPIQDGAQIHFPGKNEKEPRPSQPVGFAPAKRPEYAQTPLGEPKTAVININACSAEDLTGLPGVGPKTAQLIIAHRRANGDFARVEDLLLVKGIGPKKYDAIRNLITVERS